MFPFDTPWKLQKKQSFSGGIEIKKCAKTKWLFPEILTGSLKGQQYPNFLWSKTQTPEFKVLVQFTKLEDCLIWCSDLKTAEDNTATFSKSKY